MTDPTITHKIRAMAAGASANLEVTYNSADAPHALVALNDAVAKLRSLIDREIPCSAEAAPAFPSALIDESDDRWEHEGDGLYHCPPYQSDRFNGRTLEWVRREYGIQREIL